MRRLNRVATVLLSIGLFFTPVSSSAFSPDVRDDTTIPPISSQSCIKDLKTAKKIKITLNKKSVSLAKPGKTVKIKATASRAGKPYKKLRWESSDTSVAVVDKNGKVTAVDQGTCYVSVYAKDGTSAKVKVTVKTGTPAKKSIIEKYKEEGNWEVAYEVTLNGQDYLSDGKTREGWYYIKPAQKGQAGSYQWIQSDGKMITDDRPVVTVTSKVKVAFGRGDNSKPWYFFGKGVTLEREPS